MQIQLEEEYTASSSRSMLRLVQINFNGETEAIALALQQLLNRLQAFEKVVILVDSKAANQAVSSISQPKSKKINDIKQVLKHLQAFKKTVIFQWVPSRLEGNEIADKLAKKGTTLHTKETPLSADSPNKLLNCKISTNKKLMRWLQQRKTQTSIKTGQNTKVNLGRKWQKNFRLKKGHHCPAAHLRLAYINLVSAQYANSKLHHG